MMRIMNVNMIPVMHADCVVTMVIKVMKDMAITNALVDSGCAKHLIVKIQT